MKKLHAFFLLLAIAVMGYSASLRAEDIDIYVDNPVNNAVPNVLFVIDTGANFSSSAPVPCTAYASGGSPSMGGTAGGIEQCALVDGISALIDGSVNVGIMVNNNNGFATDVQTTGAASHETCQGTYGGCLVRKLTLMDAAGKAGMINFIKSWKTAGSNSATEFNVKSGGDRTANMMQEVWAYFHGKTGMSTKNYGTSLLAVGCQRNYVVFIGNAFNNSGTPGDSGVESPYDGTHGLTAAQTAATTQQKAKITTTQKFGTATCGVTELAAGSSTSDWSANWADEWARIMFQQDGGETSTDTSQNIITYTIGLVNDGSCKPEYPALMSSMARVGGGKYFKASNAEDMKLALFTILNEVQAVNSVFSSASLPVSVNAEGTFLNQIYLGMFRPEAGGAPRWLGNLKQYQLVKNSLGDFVMGDKNGDPALSSSGTGFLSPTAVSFWTYKDTAVAPDDATTGGFFVNNRLGVLQSPYDSADGEVVEKGGVAQQLRKENLKATFSGAAGTSSNPRRLYTYCPGVTCYPALTDPSNEFSTNNADIAASAFGDSSTFAVASITRSGNTATVTTTGNHGLSSGASVTISNVNQPEYNGTKSITVTGAKTFTFGGVPEYPTTPTIGTYSVSVPGGTSLPISTLVRSTSTTGSKNTETVTVTTSTAHGYITADTVGISGADQSQYNFTGNPASVPSTTTFTFPVTVSPPSNPANSYAAAINGGSYPARSVTLSRSSNTIQGLTSTAHGFWVGQSITIGGAADYNGTYAVQSVANATTFTVSKSALGNPPTATGTVQPDVSAKSINLTRVATTESAKAIASGAPARFFGNAVGATRTVNIVKDSGLATNETAYEKSGVTITCTVADCSSFEYDITVAPVVTGTGTMSAAKLGASGTVAIGDITRSGTTASAVVAVSAGSFTTGQTVNIAASGTAQAGEAAYIGSWPITCTDAGCTTFTFGPVSVTPVTPATGTNMQAYAAGVAPDRDTVIKWLRGLDSQGDENGPGASVTVRPSVHGDVLHSRPVVINYGDARGIVVYYGANDGVYRAVNGSQTAAIGSVPAGGELWGLIFKEHYGEVNRLRLNSPELKFPSTTLSTAQPKDYFIDGPTGAYQIYKADGTIDKAYIYVTMRRGGRFLYALDVTIPTAPTVLWRIDPTVAGYEELGQTWSRPRLTLLQRGGTTNKSTPMLVFGGGYDSAEDSEPPGTGSMGRGVYVVNALTGALVWSATPTCTGGVDSPTCKYTPGMTHAVPTDIRTVDRDGNGYTDKLYFGDLGGNVWRADVATDDPATWSVTKLAALGCATGACSLGTTPRKFLFPPEVLTVKDSSDSTSYDAVFIASGDREHPLKSTASGSSYNVSDKAFMVKDTGTALNTPSTNNVALTGLFDATSTPYDGSVNGFYITFATGEKAVNAPLAVSGKVFFATNRPTDRSATCAANLGEAKAYAVSPFTGAVDTNVLAGGGLPPGAVTGLVTVTNADGTSSTTRLCIGCGGVGGDSGATKPANVSGLENTPPVVTIDKNLKRTYWYKK